MTHPCAFVDPSSLSLPSSPKRSVSPDSSSDRFSPLPTDEPPRKRSRSAVTPEERKEARAHRNRIAAQNSRDRRKAQFVYLERRVAELEEENRRLRAGIHVTMSPSTPCTSEPDVSIEREQEQVRKHEQEQRDHENQELRERIRSLEKGYEAVVRALAAQSPATSTMSTPSAPSTASPSHLNSSSQPPSHDPSSPETPFILPQQSLDLSLTISSPTRHLARRVGGAKMVTRPASTARCWPMMRRRPCPKTRQPRTLPLRVCSRKSSRRHRLALALFRALALRQKMHSARRRC
ncbi:hypothetical protein JVU11DRAFT_2382 [Chiua virens]|nr:hypothetical protein JVU11DRAFT_2382 [Chiua virens]